MAVLSARSVGPALRAALSTVFRKRRLPAGIRRRSPRGDVVVGVFFRTDVVGRERFTRSANRRGIASLGIELWGDELVIGPLTVPRRPGCGVCAVHRMRGAAAALGTVPRRRQAPILDAALAHIAAREISTALMPSVGACQLLDHVLVVNARTGEKTRHRVIPLPRCRVCGGAAAAMPAATAHTRGPWIRESDDVAAVLSGWVDRRTGVISAVVLERLAGPAGLPAVATAAPPVVASADGRLRTLPVGWGKGLTPTGAVLSAVGEAIERYSACLPDPDRVVFKRPDELDGDYLAPSAFALYTDAQYATKGFPCVRYDPRVRHPWVLGTWMGSTRPVWVPAILAFLSLSVRREHVFCQGTSNGLAAATEFDQAVLQATFEIVERDALLFAWLTGRPGVRIELDDACDQRLRSVIDAVGALGATVEAYLLPDGVYGATVLCLALGDGHRYPGVTFGLATDVDAHGALHRAVLELGQTGPYLRRMLQSRTLVAPPSPRAVSGMLDHASYYFPKRRASAFAALRNGGARVALSGIPRRRPRRPLEDCARALSAAGIRVAVVDVTSPDVATGPFRVARAVSPDLQTLSYGFGMDRVPVERIRIRGIRRPLPPVQPVW